MPPRYVYWTIIVDGQPTAFRSGSLEDIMPTFNRLKEKQPTAELKWFQHGKLWSSRHDAQDFMRARGDRGRERDPRQGRDQGSGIRDQGSGIGDQGSGTGDQGSTRPERAWNAKPEWKTRTTFKPASAKATARPVSGDKPAWVPKGGSSPKPQGDKPEWVPKSASPKPQASSRSFDDRPAGQARGSKPPEWKPKGTFKPKEAGHSSGWGEKPGWKSKDRDKKPTFAPRSPGTSARQAPAGKPEWKSKGDSGGKPEWKPKGTFRPKEEGHRPSTHAKSAVHKSARDEARSSFRPKSYTPKDEGGPTRSSKARDQKLDWKPKGAERRGDGPNSGFARNKDGVASGFSRSQSEGNDRPEGKRKWVPKADYKKSLGIEAKRDDKWRPGGEHKDPKQKYKDAKKAKWTRFKQAIRTRSTKPRQPKDE